MLNPDSSNDENDYEHIQGEHLSGGIDDDEIDPFRWVIDDDDEDEDQVGHNSIDDPCGCCDECKWAEQSEDECDCLKCKSCGECENACSEGFCEECELHHNECECENYCECCETCEDNEWLEGECQCVQCETCLVCEQTCLEQKCEKCLCHVVDDVCVNCGAIGRPDEGGQLLLKDSNKPMAPKRAFRSWSKSEKSIMRSLFISGMSLAEIANHLDRTENAVVVQLANLRLLSDVDLSNAVHQAQARYNRVIKRDPETPS